MILGLIITKQYSNCSSQTMKTSQSFFPTRTHLKSRQVHQEHSYQVAKPTQNATTSTKLLTEPANIFRDNSNPPRKQDISQLQFRPVGGKDIFKKINRTSKERVNDNRKLSKRSIRNNTQNNIGSNLGPRFKREPEESIEFSPLKSILENKDADNSSSFIPEELLKSHATYDPYLSSSKIKNSSITPKYSQKSQNLFRPVTSTAKRHQKWTADQRKEYHDKSALLNEINYKKPLVQVYGDRYFEFMLRNRFQQDFKPPAYVYLLSNKKFTDSRAITRLKYYKPEIMQKEMIVIKGRKLKSDCEQI